MPSTLSPKQKVLRKKVYNAGPAGYRPESDRERPGLQALRTRGLVRLFDGDLWQLTDAGRESEERSLRAGNQRVSDEEHRIASQTTHPPQEVSDPSRGLSYGGRHVPPLPTPDKTPEEE